MPLIKLIGAANRQSPVIARQILPLYHSNTKLGCVMTNAIRVFTDWPIAGVMGLSGGPATGVKLVFTNGKVYNRDYTV